MSAVIEADQLGKRYGRRWALHDCTLTIPEGKVVGLVGPNGAGKTTLLNLAVGLLRPTAGTITVLGGRPGDNPAQLGRVGFVAQDTPTYARVSIANHLRMGAWLNPTWDSELAESRIDQLELDSAEERRLRQPFACLAQALDAALRGVDRDLVEPLARRAALAPLQDLVHRQARCLRPCA